MTQLFQNRNYSKEETKTRSPDFFLFTCLSLFWRRDALGGGAGAKAGGERKVTVIPDFFQTSKPHTVVCISALP